MKYRFFEEATDSRATEKITLEGILDSYRTQNAEEGFLDYCI